MIFFKAKETTPGHKEISEIIDAEDWGRKRNGGTGNSDFWRWWNEGISRGIRLKKNSLWSKVRAICKNELRNCGVATQNRIFSVCYRNFAIPLKVHWTVWKHQFGNGKLQKKVGITLNLAQWNSIICKLKKN